jgi:hypothetical protein
VSAAPVVDDTGMVVGVLSLDDLPGEAVEKVKHLTSVMREARWRKILDLP